MGDVILSTCLIEAVRHQYPGAAIDFLVRQGNDKALTHHPVLREVLIWFKTEKKWLNFFKILKQMRRRKYSLIINVQRHFPTAFLTVFAGAETTCGYLTNFMSRFFTHAIPHHLLKKKHEVERCLDLLAPIWTDTKPVYSFKPRLYPVEVQLPKPYITINPTTARATKKVPADKWVELINSVPAHLKVYLCCAPHEHAECQAIADATKRSGVEVLSHNYSLLQTASIFAGAVLNYVLDSAANHVCSAVNAPVCTVYCSTSESFGFGPLSTQRSIVAVKNLPCRPCTSHGRDRCPLRHFRCGHELPVAALTESLKQALET